MCGIAGLIVRRDRETTNSVALSKAIAHRGPDDAGESIACCQEWTVQLFHRRLSILDLSPLGHQPMIDPINDSVLVFNGEIYNYQRLKQQLVAAGATFLGGSDTEVLLHGFRLWGVQRTTALLEGMFAFAYWNPADRRITLARDISGIKPLYYYHSNQELVFASEARAVVASRYLDKSFDQHAVSLFLQYGAYQHPTTPFAGVQSLEPGTLVDFQLTSQHISQSKQLHIPYQHALPQANIKPPVQTVRELFRCAVEDHLISDVPVAVFLSAGIDSTLIASVAGELQPDIQSFTIGSELLHENDERTIAAETARKYGLKHTTVSLSDTQMTDLFRQWLDSLDTPSIDGLNTFMISWAVRQQGFKVALTGLGSDELFCGYPSFQDVPKLLKLKSWLRYLPKFAQQGLLKFVARKQSEVGRMKLLQLPQTDATLLDIYLLRRQLFTTAELHSLGVDPPSRTAAAASGLDPIQSISKYESIYYQGNMLLRDSDVMSMAHGLELRTPFLDQQLVHYVSNLPGEIRQPHNAEPKHLLRQAFADVLPDSVTKRKKTGFVLPIREWMMGPMRDLCEHNVKVCIEKLNFSKAGVEGVWNKMLNPDGAAYWSRGLSLVALGHFADRHFSS